MEESSTTADEDIPQPACAAETPIELSSHSSIRFADVDGDGRLEAWTLDSTYEDGKTEVVVVGHEVDVDGDVEIVDEATMIAGAQFGDIDGDGFDDVFTLGRTWTRGSADGLAAEPAGPFGVSFEDDVWPFNVFRDLDGDGRMDIFAEARIFRGEGDGGFSPSETIAHLGREMAVVSTGDDTFIVRSQFECAPLCTDSFVTELRWVHPSLSVLAQVRRPAEYNFFALADVTRDGNLDILKYETQHPTQPSHPRMLLRTVLPGLRLSDEQLIASGRVASPFVADFDGDGFEDIVYEEERTRWIMIWGSADGLSAPQMVEVSDDRHIRYAADVDNDGAAELLCEAFREDAVFKFDFTRCD